MKLKELGSEVQFSRYNASQTSRYRGTNPQNLAAREEISQPIRRKHTAESIYCVQSGDGSEVEMATHEYNESSLPFRQCTNSTTTSIETITRIRSNTTATAKLKNGTDAVRTQKPTSRTSNSASPTLNSSSSVKQSSKQKTSFQFVPAQPETALSLSSSTATAKGLPRKKKANKKGGSGAVPKPPPLTTTFDVEQSSLVSELVALSSTAITRSPFSLDDISSWDMDILPSIPSPPDSPMSQNNTIATASSNASSASSDAPFSTPYDEDALLENEIPFPLNKHSNVIENMGIKKAKNLYKGKESLLNRNITTIRPELHPYSGSTTNAVPLRSLNPLIAGNPFQQEEQYTFSSRSTTPGTSIGPSSSSRDVWGCVHLGAADCELSIAFPQTSHYEVWDIGDEAVFACPVFLCLMVKDPRIWVGTPISLPDVSLVAIRCDDLPVPSSMSVYDPSIEYGIQCIVPQKRALDRGLLPPSFSSSSSHNQKTGAIPFVVNHKEITIDGRWERIHTKPKLEGRSSQTRILRIEDTTPGSIGDGTGRGWYLKFWIPIPARLFMKRETRIFEIRASVWMMGDEERVLTSATDLEGEEEEDFHLIADTEMTVSHLRREREMMMMTMD